MSQRRKLEREYVFNRVTPDLMEQVAKLSPADREKFGLENAPSEVAEEPAPPKKTTRKKAES